MMRRAAYLGLAALGMAMTFLVTPRTRVSQEICLFSACAIGLVVAYVPLHVVVRINEKKRGQSDRCSLQILRRTR